MSDTILHLTQQAIPAPVCLHVQAELSKNASTQICWLVSWLVSWLVKSVYIRSGKAFMVSIDAVKYLESAVWHFSRTNVLGCYVC